MHTSRKFRHVDGFLDQTDYLEVFEDGTVNQVRKDGSIKEGFGKTYKLKYCESRVAKGVWEEVK
jgi:hypothetical protein